MARRFSVLSVQFIQLSVLTLFNNQVIHNRAQSVFSSYIVSFFYISFDGI